MNNKIALHMCYWSGTEIGQRLDDVIAYTAQMQPDVLELHPSAFLDLSRRERLELRKKIEDLGMSISVNSGLVTAANDPSSPDPEIRKIGQAHCRRLLEACADMGSPYWSGLMHSAWCLKPSMDDAMGDKQRTWERSVAAMKEISKVAQDCGVICAIEIVNRYEHFLLNTAGEGIAFCSAVDHPYCKMLLDVFHMSIEEDNLADAVVQGQTSGFLACIHVGETNRRIPTGGPTNIDWPGFGRAIRESGYDGPLVLEPLPFATSATAAKVCLWRNVADPYDKEKLVADGRRAVAFMRGLTT